MRSEVDNCITFNQLRGQCQNHQGSEGPPSWQAHNTLRRSECASSGEISCPSFWKGRKFLGHNLWGGTIFGRNLCHGLLGRWFFCFLARRTENPWKPWDTTRAECLLFSFLDEPGRSCAVHPELPVSTLSLKGSHLPRYMAPDSPAPQSGNRSFWHCGLNWPVRGQAKSLRT